MKSAALHLADKMILSAAALIVAADWALPSYMTLFFDELALFVCVWAMGKTHKWRETSEGQT